MVQTYNTIELRYASSELAKNQFVTEKSYEVAREYGRRMFDKAYTLALTKGELLEEIEILRNERTHWHNMYNAVSAPANESGPDRAMPEQ